MGYAVGAACGGFLTEHLSYQSTGLLACGCCLLGLAVGFPSLHTQFNHRHSTASPPQTST
jgi:predicted MFS family arabinose efflux permease